MPFSAETPYRPRPMGPPILRIVLYLLSFFAVQIVVARLFALAWEASGLQTLIAEDSSGLAGEILVGVAALAGLPMLGITLLFSRSLDRRDLTGMGLRWPWGGPAAAMREAAVLPCASFALAGLWLGLAVLAGAVTVLRREPASAVAAAFLFLAFLVQSGLEELMFRGYVFRALRERWSAPAAAVTASLLFGLLHAANPGFTVVALLNVFLAGVILSSLVERSGSLWGATLAHGAWNFALAFLVSEPVSGYITPHLLYLLPEGSDWLTGGDFGPEGSLLLSALVLPLAALLWPWRRKPGRSQGQLIDSTILPNTPPPASVL